MTSVLEQQLSKLKAALSTLESYNFPTKYNSTTNDNNDTAAVVVDNTQPLLDPQILHRYQKARDTYIQQRCEELYLQHISTFDGSQFQFPPLPTEEEEREVAKDVEMVKEKLIQTAKNVSDSFQKMQCLHLTFEERKAEIGRIVQEMEEAAAGKEDDVTMELGTDDEEEEEENVAAQEKQLELLIRKKAELEAKLRSIRSTTSQVELHCEDLKQGIKQHQSQRQTQFSVPPNDTDTQDVEMMMMMKDDDDADDENMEKATKQITEKTKITETEISKLQNMSEWYNSIREVMEELSDLKIISVEHAPPPSSSSDQKEEEEEEEELVVQLKLLDVHILRIGLGPTATTDKKNSSPLRVMNASLVTSSILTDAMFKYDSDDDDNNDATTTTPTNENKNPNSTKKSPQEKATVSLTIPPLDDLVHQSSTYLKPPHDIQFVIRESMARIRSFTSRVVELGILRTRYLTQIQSISSSSTSSSSSPLDQEVVCTLNAQITVVLRLTPDCPTLPNSVYVDQIVGVGGWSRKDLEEMKDVVNGKGCFGPVSLMEELVREIERREANVPRTPTLPLRRKKG